jgi:hypothetical protein
MLNYVISKEAAEAQLDELTDAYDVKSIGELMDDDATEHKLLKQALMRLREALMLGRIEISMGEGIVITQHLKRPLGERSDIIYPEIQGKHKIAMKDDDPMMKKCYSMLGAITGLNATGITSMKGADLSVAEGIGMFFLAV